MLALYEESFARQKVKFCRLCYLGVFLDRWK